VKSDARAAAADKQKSEAAKNLAQETAPMLNSGMPQTFNPAKG